jgi:hypothetical protein
MDAWCIVACHFTFGHFTTDMIFIVDIISRLFDYSSHDALFEGLAGRRHCGLHSTA